MSRLAVQRLFAMDEARFGLKVTHRRLWCPFGSRPPWIHDHQYHWFWLYAAVEPVSGTCFALFLLRHARDFIRYAGQRFNSLFRKIEQGNQMWVLFTERCVDRLLLFRVRVGRRHARQCLQLSSECRNLRFEIRTLS